MVKSKNLAKNLFLNILDTCIYSKGRGFKVKWQSLHNFNEWSVTTGKCI